MGHAHYSTTQRYMHHKPRREDAAALAEAFGGADSEKDPEASRAGHPATSFRSARFRS
jgi:hypothetical protein